MTTRQTPDAVREALEPIRKLLDASDSPWKVTTLPWEVVPSDGKPIIASNRHGNLFRGYIATWAEADLIVAIANGMPAVIAALDGPAGVKDASGLRDFADRVMDAATACCTDPDGGPEDQASVSFTGEEGVQLANDLHALLIRVADAERDRDALLGAIGFRAGPLDNELSRKVILEDAAGLRGEMVKARQAAQEAEGSAMTYHAILGEFVHDSRSGVLGRMWEELKALRYKVIRLPTHLEPDAADVAMLLNGTLSGCAHCGGTPTTFARYFGHSGIFQQHVSCSRCHASMLVNARDREEARRLAIAAWDRRPAAVAGGSIHSIPPGFTLHEVEMDVECGCPEETWDTPYGSLNMHLTGNGASNAHLDNGDGGEWSKELAFQTIAEARAAFFGWAMGIDQGLPSEEAVGRWGSIAAYRGPVVELKAERPYYLASCDHCGWVGSSEKCGTDTGGDDSSVYCPRCHLPGADCGKVADAIPAAEADRG